jgi:hypothetical protein
MKNLITQEEKTNIDEICKKYKIKKYSINPDGSIDVNGDVNLSDKNINKLPLKFGKVSGDFYCDENNLTSLECCPDEVGGYFYCYSNELTSLEHCPTEVGLGFSCVFNKLTSLEGCPSKVVGNFNCHHNEITSLEYCPTIVGGDFLCHTNSLPEEFHDLFDYLSDDERRIFLKYQDQMGVWYNGYDHEACKELIEEIKTGLL